MLQSGPAGYIRLCRGRAGTGSVAAIPDTPDKNTTVHLPQKNNSKNSDDAENQVAGVDREMVPELGQRPVYASAGWEIDLARRELRSRGVPVPLGGRAFEVVAELARSGGELVTKSDLTKRVWPRTFIDEGALRVHIAAIRKAFGPDRDMLMTTVGRGYRLRGNWEVRHASAAGDPPAVKPMLARAEPLSTNLPAARFRPDRPRLGRCLCAGAAVGLSGGDPDRARRDRQNRTRARGRPVPASNLRATACWSNWLRCPARNWSPRRLPAFSVSSWTARRFRSASVARAIAARECLLVLDNCEHVVDAVAELTEDDREPLSAHHGSRHQPRIASHRRRASLSRSPARRAPETQVEPSDALGHAAVELFIARAAALGSGFQADEENFAAIVSICRRLDGIPLAIEFAAARTVMLGPPEIAALLDDRFKFLTTGRRTALPRHQTLRATLDWSYDLLPESERGYCASLRYSPAIFRSMPRLPWRKTSPPRPRITLPIWSRSRWSSPIFAARTRIIICSKPPAPMRWRSCATAASIGRPHAAMPNIIGISLRRPRPRARRSRRPSGWRSTAGTSTTYAPAWIGRSRPDGDPPIGVALTVSRGADMGPAVAAWVSAASAPNWR